MSTSASASPECPLPDVRGRTAIITGATRGIGKECALALARLGCNITIAAKTTEPQPTLPGTIYSVAKEIEALGVKALPVKVDVRKEEDVNACIAKTMDSFGRIDILINNASALWWQDITDTPLSRYNLMNEVNARGTFLMTKACLPHMKAAGYGHVITMSPPINPTAQGVHHTAYTISKWGMTIVALGVANELGGKGIAANSLWPATVIESLASQNFQLGTKAMWRKASILSDACLAIIAEDPNKIESTGRMLIDDTYLASRGVSDFTMYRCDPDVEPPRLLAGEALPETSLGESKDLFKRGKVPTADKRQQMRTNLQKQEEDLRASTGGSKL